MIPLSYKACQYLVSTRINRIETVFPCTPFLLFVLCLLSRSSWNLCSNRGVGQIIIIIIIIYFIRYIIKIKLSHCTSFETLHIQIYMYLYVVVVVVVLTNSVSIGSTTQHHEPMPRPSKLDWTQAGAICWLPKCMGHIWPYTVLYYVRINSCDTQTN